MTAATPLDLDLDEDSPVHSVISRASSCSTLVSFGDHSFMSARDTPTLIQNSCWDRRGR